MEGREVVVRLRAYHVLRSPEGRRAGFWEVSGVEGLGESEYAPQSSLYHVTDTASLKMVTPSELSGLISEWRARQLVGWVVERLPISEECGQLGGMCVPAMVKSHG